MSLKDKISHWYTKKRRGYIFGLSQWIITTPKAFEIILYMGFGVSILIFGGLGVMSWVWGWNPFAKVMFALAFGLVCYQLYKMIRIRKSMSGAFESIFSNLTIKGVMGGDKDEYGYEQDRQEDDGQSDWNATKSTRKDHTSIAKRLRCYKGQSERADTSTSDNIPCDEGSCRKSKVNEQGL